MNNLWLITANLIETRWDGNDRLRSSTQIPTFLMDGNIQGFTDMNGAKHAARRLLNTASGWDEHSDWYYAINAEKVWTND